MSFHSGRVSFSRFAVSGDAPKAVDETALSLLREAAFEESPIGAPDEVEVGWVTGEHLLDTQFAFDKNSFGRGYNLMLFAMRMDTHKVPAEVKRAYHKINLDAAATDNPSGFASKHDKREAKELADRQVHEDLAAGKFRRSKMIPVLWDLQQQLLFVGGSGTTMLEHLTALFRQTFACDLQPLSAGQMVSRLMHDRGLSRDFQDMRPSKFTPPPGGAAESDEGESDGTPLVPWTQKAVDMKDFVGNEFLIWLWWVIENHEGPITCANGDGKSRNLYLAIDKALDMDCAWDALGKQTLRGNGPTRLKEAGEALATGKWPRKAGVILNDGEHQWEFTLQGDQFNINSAALPDVEGIETRREALEARIDLTLELAHHLDALYQRFLESRCNGTWADKRQHIRSWIQQRRSQPAGDARAAAPEHVDAVAEAATA